MVGQMLNELSTPRQVDDLKSDARLNVLYSPFRKREVNPQDWESKMSFWKNAIKNWCLECKNCIFTINKLQTVFVRNGRPALCLTTVLEDMLRSNEVISLENLLSMNSSSQSWSVWAVNWFIKAPVTWSFNKLKESLVSKPNLNGDEEFVHLEVLKDFSEEIKRKCKSSTKTIFSLEEIKTALDVKDEILVKVVLHWMQVHGEASVMTVFNRTIVKFPSDNEEAKPLTDADVGFYQLQQNERSLINMLEQLEKEKQEAEEEARSYLRKGMRQVAKSCLRKKKELEKCIEKRVSALENVQVLLTRVKEAESDKEILDSYKMGLSALKSKFKEAGISEEGVSNTMDEVKEVLEVHEEIQSALSEPMAAGYEADLENELAELLSANADQPLSDLGEFDNSLPDLPEPPSDSPRSLVNTPRTTRFVQEALK